MTFSGKKVTVDISIKGEVTLQWGVPWVQHGVLIRGAGMKTCRQKRWDSQRAGCQPLGTWKAKGEFL